MKVLQIDSSAREAPSLSRKLTSYAATTLADGNLEYITHRDLTKSDLPFVTESMVNAFGRPEAELSVAERAMVAPSDRLVEELIAAEAIVIGVPIYNFSVPATVKAWIDLVARARKTFRYQSGKGSQGLIETKQVVAIVVSGGTGIGSDIDFASGYLRHFFDFIGLSDFTLIAVDGSKHDTDEEMLAFGRSEIDSYVQQVTPDQV